MKASIFDWVKLMLDNSKVIYPLIILLISITGLSTYNTIEAELEIEATQNQIIEIANYYADGKDIKPESIIKDNCKSCKALLLEHKREFHQ